MPKFAIAVIIAVALVLPALSVAGADANAKPSSFVPHPHTSHHVYGAPLQPVIGGHGRTSQHRQAPKKRGPVTASSPGPQ